MKIDSDQSADHLGQRIAYSALAVSLVGAIALVACTTSIFKDDGWLYKFQTLVAGVIAIVAAFIGGHFINKQINSSFEIERERRSRKFRSIRSTIPITLNEICDYNHAVNEFLLNSYFQVKDNRLPPDANIMEIPKFPYSIIKALQEIIEFGDDTISSHIFQIIRKAQIQDARLSKFKKIGDDYSEMILGYNILVYMVENAKMYAIAVSMFDYARYRSESVNKEIGFDELISAIESLLKSRYAVDGIYQLARQMSGDLLYE